jgi:predicted nucleic acid-binding protein
MQNESLDTNVVLRLLLADTPDQHQKAVALIGDDSRCFYVSDIALSELAYALETHYRFSRKQVQLAFADLTANDNIICNAALNEALPFYVSHPKLSFQDCLLAQIAQTAGHVPFWTFDRKLANQHASARLLA